MQGLQKGYRVLEDLELSLQAVGLCFDPVGRRNEILPRCQHVQCENMVIAQDRALLGWVG